MLHLKIFCLHDRKEGKEDKNKQTKDNNTSCDAHMHQLYFSVF